MWQQKLGTSGVAAFPWQEEHDSSPIVTHGSTTEDKKPDSKFHNPALAAIRASQQLQELVNKGELNGAEEGTQSSIHALHELAAEQDRKFKQETDDSEPSTPEGQWNHPTANSDVTHHLKRRISEVSDVEVQPVRPTLPSIESLSYYTPASTQPPVLNQSLDHLYPSPPPRRRPDPNDDTIGSDLDDSEEEGDIDSDVEDENMPLMLCLYDKVHRTKNKWRATLNHGIVCIGGREWVFEKGSGEYEW
jgi:hypothetical protein